MTTLLTFPRRGNFTYRQPSTFEAHKLRWLWHFGRDAYWCFLAKRHRFPTPIEADGLGRLLGVKVRADDGKYYGVGINPLYRRRRK